MERFKMLKSSHQGLFHIKGFQAVAERAFFPDCRCFKVMVQVLVDHCFLVLVARNRLTQVVKKDFKLSTEHTMHKERT